MRASSVTNKKVKFSNNNAKIQSKPTTNFLARSGEYSDLDKSLPLSKLFSPLRSPLPTQ